MADYIPIFLDFVDAAEELSDAETGRLIKALVTYARGGDWQNQLKGNEKFVFRFLTGYIDRHFEHLNSQRERARSGGQARLSTAKRGLANNNNNENNNDNKNNREDTNVSSCAELRKAPSTPTPSAYDIPLADGTVYNVPEENITAYRGLYPGVDVEQALRNMIGWCMSHEKQRKTRRGVKAFITSWLTREQDKPGRKGGVNSGADTKRADEGEDLFAGFTADEIAEYERLANDGEHWG